MRRADQYVRLLLIFLLMASAAWVPSGCGGGGDSDSVSNDAVTAIGVQDTGGSRSTATADTGSPSIESITQSISAIRQLPVMESINIAYINREELGVELSQELQKEYPQEEIDVEEKVLKQLDLLDPDANLGDTVSQLLGEGVLGYYDQETKELKVVSDNETTNLSALDELTLAHEITHALQDQSFSLGSLLPTGGSGNDDRDLAVLALIEGDATVAEEEYAARNMGLADVLSLLMSSLSSPFGMGPSSYIEDSITFPYTQGREFVLAILNDGGWQAVNNVYAKPPASSEQVMHPEKYIAGEAPVEVLVPELGDALGEGWSHTYENVIGEFDVLDILRAWGAGSAATGAAAGWGGGSIELYEQGNGGGQVLVIALDWDSVADADEFTVAMGDSLEARTGSPFVFQPGRVPFLENGGEYWLLAQRGEAAVVVSAPDREQGERIASTILSLS